MKRRGAGSIASLMLALLFCGCGQNRLTPPDGAAKIGKVVIPYSEFEHYLAGNVGLDHETVLPSEVLSRLFDQFLQEMLFREVALEKGLIQPHETGPLVVESLVDHLNTRVSSAEVEAYFYDHPEQFQQPERVFMRQILTEDRGIAVQMAQALESGLSLDDALARFKGSGESKVSGREDELTRKDLPQSFAETIFALEVGAVSEVVSADYGFHVFQVVDRRPSGAVDFEAATAQILGILEAGKAEEGLASLLETARSRYNVEVYLRNLPFNYEGNFATTENLDS